ncbi:hypothetical protein IVB18_15515 [Bradyrhizobium sp. 186]|uniref:hypothetical protein n=1 Tax=Bradyrhizobium sp. 186 TaxID=2782654 RepID=UPI0020017CD6|nr:hypothetical protein [Bradyrhizobium sp. 186]UPK38521.1 hypothetical protein IVB18_15515 [Bradyrhizobium sp. 186]
MVLFAKPDHVRRDREYDDKTILAPLKETPDAALEEVMRKTWPFYGVMLFVLMVVAYLPEISLWQPRMVQR